MPHAADRLGLSSFTFNNNNTKKSSDDSYFQTYLSSWSSLGAIPDNLPVKQPFWDRPGIQADRML